MPPYLLRTFLTAILALAGATYAHAGLVVAVGDAEIAEGGCGYVNVVVYSDPHDSQPQSLNDFGFQFVVASLGNSHRLDFMDPQPEDPYYPLLDEYVFHGDSFVAQTPPVGNISEGTVPFDTYTGGDLTDSGDDVTVDIPLLLTRLFFTTVTDVAPVVGDRFQVSLIDNAFTYFDNTGGSVPYTATPGQITIASAQQTVPEPSSWILIVGCLATGLLVGWTRRRQRAFALGC